MCHTYLSHFQAWFHDPLQPSVKSSFAAELKTEIEEIHEKENVSKTEHPTQLLPAIASHTVLWVLAIMMKVEDMTFNTKNNMTMSDQSQSETFCPIWEKFP